MSLKAAKFPSRPNKLARRALYTHLKKTLLRGAMDQSGQSNESEMAKCVWTLFPAKPYQNALAIWQTWKLFIYEDMQYVIHFAKVYQK
jgi:hypothetical protein